MKVFLLKFHIVFFLLLLFSFVVRAQNFRYIYIQTENQMPFYVKMGEQTIRSSSSGYIIIARLTEGSYKITIGFPKSTLPELLVSVVLNDADAGYLLRNDLDQGLYMIDLSTKAFVPTEMQWSPSKNVVKSKDEFARILSEVVNDSTINEIGVFKKPEATITKIEVKKIPDNPIPVEPVAAIKNIPEVIIDTIVKILKLEQKSAAGWLSIKYVDDADTIDVFVPVRETVLQVVNELKIADIIGISKKEIEPVKDVKFIDMELQNPNQNADSGTIEKNDFVIKQKKNASTGLLPANNDDSVASLKTDKCKNIATQKDFLDLRKKMAAQKTETAMQKIVASEFNKTCFTTEHIKNLGVLFITEEERYKFYVSAFPHVSDAENFATLQNQLADSYYINRFKAMLNH